MTSVSTWSYRMPADHHKTKNKINVSKCTYLLFVKEKFTWYKPLLGHYTQQREWLYTWRSWPKLLKRSRSPSPLNHTHLSFQKINTGKHVQKARVNPSIIRKYKKTKLNRQPIFIPNVGTSKNVVHGLGKWQSTLSNHIIISEINTALGVSTQEERLKSYNNQNMAN